MSNIEVEMAVMGACLLNNKLADIVMSELKKDYLTDKKHIYLFEIYQSLWNNGEMIDIYKVIKIIKDQNRLDEFQYSEQFAPELYIRTELPDACYQPTEDYLRNWIKQIKEYHWRKKIYKTASTIRKEIISGANSKDALKIYSEIESEIENDISNGSILDTPTLLDKSVNRLYDLAEGKVEGYSTGFSELDKYIRIGNRFYVLGARPAMGKTSFALKLAYQVSKNMNKPSAFFSVEMSAEDCATRLLCIESGINSNYVKGTMDKDTLFKTANNIIKSNFIIDDSVGLTPSRLKAKARKYVSDGVGFIVIDYLQKMSDDKHIGKKSYYEKYSDIVQQIDNLKKELNIPILLLSQLNREVESRTSKIPELSDLRETGAIEQHADAVMLLMYPYKYFKDADRNKAILFIAKNRYGECGEVELRFIPEYTRFEDRIINL